MSAETWAITDELRACPWRVPPVRGNRLMALASIVTLAGVLSLILTGLLRRYAIARNLLDRPNERSSHIVATPRGGGVAIVIATLLLTFAVAIGDLVRWSDAAVVLIAGGVIAVLGFVDDHGHVAARWRLLGHFIAAGVVLWGVGSLDAISAMAPWLGPAWRILFALYLVWSINLTNFMDGIDGLASSEVITTCVTAALLARAVGADASVQVLPLAVAGATAGFLAWNWPPAKIFMGDAGSGFLGIAVGALSLMAGRFSRPLFVAWLILFGCFLVDSTITLVTRVIRGKKMYEAHREHAYQRASRLRGHRFVTTTVIAINLLWLAPLAWLVATRRLSDVLGLAVALMPLAALALWLGSGRQERPAA